jgi:hypothetical protein
MMVKLMRAPHSWKWARKNEHSWCALIAHGYKHFPSISLGHSLTFGEKTDILFLSPLVISPVIDEIQILGVRLLKRLKRARAAPL